MTEVTNRSSLQLALSLAVVGAGLCIVSPDILSEGMFMDGMIYAIIAKNLSEGIGSFWIPYFTATQDPEFYGHPPLAFGLQSLFFRIFGTGISLEKVYSVLTYVATGGLIWAWWQSLKLRQSWLLFLFWLSCPVVLWASYGNLLENTLMLFTTGATLLYFGTFRRSSWWIWPCGFLLALGFLTKGFVAFFPLSFPLWLYLLRFEPSFRRTSARTLLWIFATLLPLAVILLSSAAARHYLSTYLDIQVISSLQHVQTVSWRGFIVMKLLGELAPALAIVSLVLLISWKKGITISSNTRRTAAVYFLTGLSGALPIIISLKQSGFYLIPVFPLFALAFATLVEPSFNTFFDRKRLSPTFNRVALLLGISVFALGIILSFQKADTIHRDHAKIRDCHLILPHLQEGDIIQLAPYLRTDWSLHGYYARYKNVSLDTDFTSERRFLLTLKNQEQDEFTQNYRPLALPTEAYQLWERQEP